MQSLICSQSSRGKSEHARRKNASRDRERERRERLAVPDLAAIDHAPDILKANDDDLDVLIVFGRRLGHSQIGRHERVHDLVAHAGRCIEPSHRGDRCGPVARFFLQFAGGAAEGVLAVFKRARRQLEHGLARGGPDLPDEQECIARFSADDRHQNDRTGMPNDLPLDRPTGSSGSGHDREVELSASVDQSFGRGGLLLAHGQNRTVPEAATQREAVIRLKGLRKAFNGAEVLRGVDLELPEGETTVVVGPSGCGKSVMLKHIVGLLRPDAGEVWFRDTRIDELPEHRMGPVRTRIGFLFQLSALFDSLTVEENLAFPLRERGGTDAAALETRVRDALDLVDMAGSEQKLPAELSGGQKKRVALARAIMLQPEVMLYDEPTTGLDPERAKGIDDLVVRLKDRLGVTGLVVTHDIVSARRVADRIVMLDAGAVVAQGSFEELVRSGEPRVRAFFEAAGQAASLPEH